MNKSGLVFKVERNSVILVTQTGEFVEVRVMGKEPKIGENYTGVIIERKFNNIKRTLIAAAVIIIMLSGGSAYAYFTPVATVLVQINPSIEVKINRFDRIIEATAMNDDGEVLLETLELRNYKIEEALILVVEEAKKKDFINAKYISEGKIISVEVTDGNPTYTDTIDKLESYIEDENLNLDINNNGSTIQQKYNKENENTEEIQRDNNRNDTEIENNNENSIEEKKNTVQERIKEETQNKEVEINKEKNDESVKDTTLENNKNIEGYEKNSKENSENSGDKSRNDINKNFEIQKDNQDRNQKGRYNK